MAQTDDGIRRDYAVLARVATREEAEAPASCLRAHDIDAFIGDRHHANADWTVLPALNWLQVLTPASRRAEARELIRERVRLWRDEPVVDPAEDELDEGPAPRRDARRRFIVPGYFVFYGAIYYLTRLSYSIVRDARR